MSLLLKLAILMNKPLKLLSNRLTDSTQAAEASSETPEELLDFTKS